MAYGDRYIAEFRDLDEDLYKVILRLRDYDGDSEDVVPAAQPLSLNKPRADKFAPTKGQGGEIVLYSETDRQFIDLYTADYKEWQVEILKNSETIKVGYVEAETYQEDFNVDEGYDVSIMFNDGVNVLERENYIDSDDNQYTGTDNAYNIITKALQKLDLPFSTIRYASDLKLNDYSVPSGDILLQHIDCNQDNYIDEDGIVMSCREVIKAVLTPLSLTMIFEGADIWIVDTEYLKNGSIEVHTAAFGSGSFSSETIDVEVDMNTIDQESSQFIIEAGYNLYKLTKNRYVKDIVKEEKFGNYKDYTAYWRQDITDLLDMDKKVSDHEKWQTKLDHFWFSLLDDETELWDVKDIQMINKPQYISTGVYEETDRQAFFGGIKKIEYIDNTEIHYSEDDRAFNNFLFINNPVESFDQEDKTEYQEKRTVYDYDLSSITKVVAEYKEEFPYIYKSEEVYMRLKMDVRFVIPGNTVRTFSYVEYNLKSPMPSDFSYYVYCPIIKRYDDEGNLSHFLRLKDDNVNSNSDQHPDVSNLQFRPAYEWIAYDNHSDEDMLCKMLIYKVDQLGEGKSIRNSIEEVEIFFKNNIGSNPCSIKVQLTNIFYEVWNIAERDYDQDYDDYLSDFHLRAEAIYRQELTHIGINKIKVDTVDLNFEPIELNDEELQYYLSDQYKTESEGDELTHCTADQRYNTDVAGLTLDEDYITKAEANGSSADDLEDLKGDKMIRQYKDNQIVLTINFYHDDIPAYSLMRLKSDPMWSTKKWVIVEIDYNVREREIQLTLEEVK